ncbi:MAG: OFA family MFS transporter [Candidatus Delongbacteria bacterium]|nr:OFA family MFS transporter [Candidatus Delongbacteria bacterium]
MDADKRRWLVIIAGMFSNLCQGSAYASSVFAKPIMAHFGCSREQSVLAFSLIIACLPLGAITGGKFADQKGPRAVVMVGSLIFALGVFLAGFSWNMVTLYLTYGLMMGIGSGIAYGAIVGAVVKWFPDKRGLSSGLVVGALGGGPLVLAPLAQALLDSPGLGLMGTFKVMGLAFLVVMLAAAYFISSPPKDYSPAGFNRSKPGARPMAADITWREMLKKSKFWFMFLLYAFGTFSGLMLISQASPIAQELAQAAPAMAATIVGILALANALGRVLWGAISDKLGRLEALGSMFLITTLVMISLPWVAGHIISLTLAFILVGLCFGGYLGIFPSYCADSFGSKNISVNYGILFSAFSLAGVFGPRIGAMFTYQTAFLAAAGVSLLGGILALSAKFRQTS